MIDPEQAESQFPTDRALSLGNLRLRNCHGNWLLYRRNDIWIGRALEYFGEYSIDEQRLCRELVSAGDVVVEAGANIGCITMSIANAVGTSGVIHAFEPQLDSFKILCANLAINRVDNVRPYQLALGDDMGIGSITSFETETPHNFGDATISGVDDGDPVEIITIDSLGLDRCDLIKLDVQGAERDVLIGAGETIQRFRPLLYLENDLREHSKALLATISAFGYDSYWHFPRVCSSVAKSAGTDFENVISSNLLCVPKEATVQISGLEPTTGIDDWRIAD